MSLDRQWAIGFQPILYLGPFSPAVSPFRKLLLLGSETPLELGNKAYFLYVKQPPEEKAKLLKMVLSNCAIDAVSIYPTYRKPFDLIFERVKTKEWRAQGDDFRTFLSELVSALPQTAISIYATPVRL
jgi:hypothetical protein